MDHLLPFLRRTLCSWLVVGTCLVACSDTTTLARLCTAPPPTTEQFYRGTLTTTVSGQALKETRVLHVHPEDNGVMTLGFVAGKIEDSCLVVAAGGAIRDGVCQDLSDPTGASSVKVLKGTLTVAPPVAATATAPARPETIAVAFDTSTFAFDVKANKSTPVTARIEFQGARFTPPPPPPPGQRPPPPELRMTFGKAPDLFEAPFPNQTRVLPDGSIDLTGFPEPEPAGHFYQIVTRAKWAVLRNIVDILKTMAQKNGFSVTSGIFFTSTFPLDDVDGKIRNDLNDPFVVAPVVNTGGKWRLDLVGARGTHPIKVQFREHEGSLAPANTLALLPLQGRPLREQTIYVAFVRRGLSSPSGSLGPAPDMAKLVTLTDPPPPGIPPEYVYAVNALKDANVRLDEIAAMTVFKTGSPTAELRDLFARAKAPAGFDAPFTFRQADPEFCVYETTVKMPVYQRGKPPFQVGKGVLTPFINAVLGAPLLGLEDEGDIVPGATSHESLPSRVVLTVPKKKAPAAGWPVAVFVRAGAGLDATGSPLVDRGPSLRKGDLMSGCLPPRGPADQGCGEGPAREFARAGLVGITVDGPQTGSRLQPGDADLGKLVGACAIDAKTGEDNAMFDVCNPRAIRDNIRQSAIEVALVPSLLASPLKVQGEKDGCHNGGAKLDAAHIALMGHSMGATITPLALHLQPKFRAVVLSGANGSYIENILAKENPPPALAPTLEQMLGLDYCLDEFSMLSSLFQWAEEASDPIVYEQALFADVKNHPPPNVLMIQGIGDHYIPPPVADVSAMGMRLDLLGSELDKERPKVCTGLPDDPPPTKADLEKTVPQCKDASGAWAARYPIMEVVPLLSYVGTGAIAAYPAGGVSGNRDGVTRGLVQYNRDAECRQDGHEVAYEIARARWQYRCFLASFARGQAKVWPAPEGSAGDTIEIDKECPQ